MQYRNKDLLKKYLKKYHFSIFLKVAVLLAVVYYIFLKLYNEEQLLFKIINEILLIFNSTSLFYLLIPILLVPLNWSVEAKKWQVLAAKISPINFKQAMSGVLSGLSLGFISPQGLGDYAGRIWHINNSRRSELVGSVLLGSIAQAFISVFMGLLGIAYFFNLNKLDFYFEVFSFVLITASGVGIGFIFKKNYKQSQNYLIKKLFYWSRKYLGIISTYTSAELGKIIFLSLIRYIIFFFQFVWVLLLFGIDLPLDVLCAGVSWIYVAKIIIPAFNFLSDIGVREF